MKQLFFGGPLATRLLAIAILKSRALDGSHVLQFSVKLLRSTAEPAVDREIEHGQSRSRSRSWRRTRMARTSRSLSGGFCPISLPRFQGAGHGGPLLERFGRRLEGSWRSSRHPGGVDRRWNAKKPAVAEPVGGFPTAVKCGLRIFTHRADAFRNPQDRPLWQAPPRMRREPSRLGTA
jgi:hypothetical protein